MAAPLLGPDGKVMIGVDPAAFAAPGADPQNPHAIASAFQRYEDGKADGTIPNPIAPQNRAPGQVQPQQVAPATPEAPAGGGDQQPEQVDVYSTDSLREMFEGAPDTDVMLGAITHTVGDREFTLAEAIEGYLAQPDAAIVAQQRGSLEAEFQHRDRGRQEVLDTQMKQLVSTTNQLRAQLTADEDPAAMMQLATADPVAYQARLQEIATKKLMLSNAEAEQKRADDFKARQQNEEHERWLAGEERALNAALPVWNDPVKGPVLKGQVAAYAATLGYSQQELVAITDHRVLVALTDGATAAAVRKKGATVLKAARDAKLPAPTGRQNARGEIPGKSQVANQGRADAFSRQSKSGSLDHTADVFDRLVET